ncbi:hypothetical protein [Lysobacter gummosus]|uniref:hypothetical protein n=1 Tax=Lysobacter gummosus TaxID=262324 RepID=UPI0036361006
MVCSVGAEVGVLPAATPLPAVIPANAGIQCLCRDLHESRWIPAFAGMTVWRRALKPLDSRLRGNDGLEGWR